MPQTAFTGVWLVHPDGSGRRLLTRAESNLSAPTWSPDGEQVVFQQEHFLGHDTDLYEINRDGSGLRPAVSFAWSELTPAWRAAS